MERALGVVIGLGATYLFLSVVVLAVVEALSTVLSKRSKALRRCLTAVLKVEAGGSAALLDRLLASPLLKTLGKATGAEVPSHIPTPVFVTAFLDTIGSMRGTSAEVSAAYRDALAALPEKEREVVRGIVGDAVDSVKEAERRVSLWFDALMTQLSERYRRNTQWVTRGVTLVLVLAVNANALTMGATFWRDSMVREAALQLAQRELALCTLQSAAAGAAPGAVAPAAPGGGLASGAAPAGAGTAAVDAAAPAGGAAPGAGVAAATPPAAQLDCRALLADMGSDVPLPLGWTRAVWTATWQSPGAIFAALLGLFLSFVAVCLGAPFWFDVLRRVTPLVRSPSAAAAAAPPAPAPAPAPTPGDPR